jgi:multidrug efflux pump subunit AcrB
MLFSMLVVAMTAIVLSLIGAWFFSPALRRWMEEPKYRMLHQENRFEARRIGWQGQTRETTSSATSRSEPAERLSRNSVSEQ